MYIDKRIEWIDVAKGIGILFIILGHVFNTGFLRKWIFSFHVPFFFVVAGFTFSINRGIVDFVIRKAKTLWIPYLFWSCFSIVLYSALVVIIPSFGEPLDFMNSFFVVSCRPRESREWSLIMSERQVAIPFLPAPLQFQMRHLIWNDSYGNDIE